MNPRVRLLHATFSLVLLIFYTLFARESPWQGDFWTHAAIARELSVHPFTPRNPFVIGGAPSIPYWPYNALVALVSFVFSIEPYTVLVLFGGANILIFLTALRRFCCHFLGEERLFLVGLAFILFAWGNSPWFWSATYSYKTFFFIAPYPSFLAFALTLLLAVGFHKDTSPLVLVPLSTLLFLIHPITFLFHLLLMGSITAAKRSVRRLLILVVCGAVSVLVGIIWPFFPLSLLVGSTSFTSDPNAYGVYRMVLWRIYPALLGLVPLVVCRKRSHSVFLYLLLPVTLLYLYGYLSGSWNVGRVLPLFLVILQLHLALGLLLLIDVLDRRYGKRMLSHLCMVGSGLMISIWAFATLGVARGITTPRIHELTFLKTKVGDDSTVLSDLATSLVVPSLGVRVVAINYPPFVGSDYSHRQEDIKSFFSEKTSVDERRTILGRWRVGWILLDSSVFPVSELQELSLTEVAQEGRYYLLKVG